MLIRPVLEVDHGRIATYQVFAEVSRDLHPATLATEDAAKQHHPIGRQSTQIRVVPATDTGEQGQQVRGLALIDGRVAVTESQVPPDIVFAAVTAWNAAVLARGEVHAAACQTKLFGNLIAGIPRTDDENRAWRKQLRIAVLAGMQMQCRASDRGCPHRGLKRSGRDYHVLRFKQVGLRLHDKTRCVGLSAERGCCETREQWCMDVASIADDELYDLVAGWECIPVGSPKGKAGQMNVPVRALEGQRVPSLAPPTLRHARPFKNDVFASELAEVVADRQPGLSASDDDHFDLFHDDVTNAISTRGGAIRP